MHNVAVTAHMNSGPKKDRANKQFACLLATLVLLLSDKVILVPD